MSNQEQLLRGQLGLANSGYEAERQMRLLTERRTARLRVLFYDLAVRLVPADLDNLRKERGEEDRSLGIEQSNNETISKNLPEWRGVENGG